MSAQLDALRRLAAQVRELMNDVVNTCSDADALDAASEAVARARAALADGVGAKPIPRFHWGQTQGDPQAVLPFSLISGELHPMAPPVLLSMDGDRLVGEVTLDVAYEGPVDCCHGSWVSAIYDQVLAIAGMTQGIGGPTASLTIRFRRPTPLYVPLRFEAWVERVEGNKIFSAGRCLNEAGDVLTEAEGLFIRLVAGHGKHQWRNPTADESGPPTDR